MAHQAATQQNNTRLSLKVLFSCVIAAAMFFLIEGVCNTMVVVRDVVQKPAIKERVHTRYDPDLGWVNIPDTHICLLYTSPSPRD